MQNKFRNILSNDIKQEHVGKIVRVAGWVNSIRHHGGLTFIDLRDHTGFLQCVVDASDNSEVFESAQALTLETTISVSGTVRDRPENTLNDKINTGSLELIAQQIDIISKAQPLPFSVTADYVPEELSLQYRFIDLRRDVMQNMLKLRAELIYVMHETMRSLRFMEVQTPLLTASSPEGARDYIVPSRLNPGLYFALPQAPQLFKQILMSSCVDRYYQIAPCFRDEDPRADRLLGTFYQLDFEAAFVEQQDVLDILKKLAIKIFKHFKPQACISEKFHIIQYSDAMELYGTDKPDLRINLQYQNLTHFFKYTESNILGSVIRNNGQVYCLPVPNIHKQSRKFFTKMQEIAQQHGAPGLGYILIKEDKISGPFAALLSTAAIENMRNQHIDGAFFIAGIKPYKVMHHILMAVAHELKLIPDNSYEFCFIVDYPMYDVPKATFFHNPFSMPNDLSLPLENITAQQYDLVCNGVELSSGAIRNHSIELLHDVFQKINIPVVELKKEFNSLLKAFSYGVPPHGGAAIGIDRIAMLLLNSDNVRQVVPFPLSQQGRDLLMNAPNNACPKLLKELSLK